MNNLESKFVELYSLAFPQQALSQGYWKAVHYRIIPDEQRIDKVTELISWIESLPDSDSTDVQLLKHEAQLLKIIWTKWKPWTYDPSYFNFADGLSWFLIHAPYPPEEKLSLATEYIKQIPDYLNAIRNHLQTPTKEHLRLAIEQNIGAIRFIDTVLDSAFSDVSQNHNFFLLWHNVRDAVSDFVDWLHTLLKSTSNFKSYRVSEEIYYELWKYEVSDSISPDYAYAQAQEFIDELRESIREKLSKLTGKSIDLEEVGNLLKQYSHENIIPATQWLPTLKRQLSELRDFLETSQLVSFDGLAPLVVRPTPEYMRGSGAGASITPPGPFDESPTFYYNVDPIESYPKDLQESILREYNYKTLYILNAHEAYPGHYIQLAYSLKHAGIIPNILGNTGFIEGWAVFSEKLLLDNGFNPDDILLRAFHDKWLIRVAANTVVDFETHIKGTDTNTIMDFLINRCFQEQAEAIDKWKRARLSVVQLSSYFTGYMLMNRLYKQWQQTFNDDSPANFIKWLLPQGSLPFNLFFKQLALTL